MHPLGDGSGVVVRAYLHNAAKVEVVPVSEKARAKLVLERIHDSGIFEGVAKGSGKVYAYDAGGRGLSGEHAPEPRRLFLSADVG